MTELNKSKEEKLEEEKKQKAKEYCEMIEAKLRKSEHEIWMVKDSDHLFKNQ